MLAGGTALQHSVLLHDAYTRQWRLFQRPVEVIAIHDLAQVRPALERIAQAVSQGFWAAGFLSYEAGPAFDPVLQVRAGGPIPLLWFGLYPDMQISNPQALPAASYQLEQWQPNVTRPEYEQAIRRIKAHIARGETYQVNYTIRLQAGFSGDAFGLFQALCQAQPADYAAYVDTGRYVLCSASPELFFTRTGTRLTGKPMKGTAGRGRTTAEDQERADWLYHSEKNRAENVMIVDMVRNDLGRIARTGSVRVPRLFEIERYPTLWQMTSTVEADSDAGLGEVMAALFPCASITGAPKVRTMQIIADLETTPRGVYTGCIGFVAPADAAEASTNWRAQFNVAIRTVQIDRQAQTALYGVGGGIVWDSTSAEEYEECQIKARLLTQPRPVFSLLESLLWTPQEGLFLLERHLARLADSAAYFGFPYQEAQAQAALAQVVAGLPPEAHKVRLLLGKDGQYRQEAIPLSQVPLPDTARLQLAPRPVAASNPFLYHKTTYREIYAQARLGLPPEVEALYWNEQGEVTESDTANLVVRLDGELFTPPVASGLLPGTFRGLLLETSQVQERVLYKEDLARCSELYLINSVRKWRQAHLLPPK